MSLDGDFQKHFLAFSLLPTWDQKTRKVLEQSHYPFPRCLVAQTVKARPAMQETQIWSLEEGMAPTPGFLPGESHGQRSLEGHSPRGRRVRHDWAHTTLDLKSYWFSLCHLFFFFHFKCGSCNCQALYTLELKPEFSKIFTWMELYSIFSSFGFLSQHNYFEIHPWCSMNS